MSQVVRELNKTLYKDTKTVTFGSRDVLCLNKIVTSEKNSTMKTLMCRNLTKNRKCRFHNELESKSVVILVEVLFRKLFHRLQ
ncbi:unnamed protein product [Anisakis simplex]|uniref:RAD3-like helicase DEAD domain-containing protein n=1 Tax=Anisakis simplex TaxID=6269 RepID=A0A3P6S8F0_ANISI|nr:unnamed protein product [Anisakis simplex]